MNNVVEMKMENVSLLPDSLLTDILSTKRCHGSPGDIDFRQWLRKDLERMGVKVRVGAAGCLVATTDPKSTILFSCHVDTVHNAKESDGSKQALFYDKDFDHIILGDKKATCLGADDGVGIYIMLKMVEAKVPGYYVFHVGEERGGIGARAMLDAEGEWLRTFSISIAFDRPGDHEVIVTQGGTACASLKFGEQLAGLLNAKGLKYEVSHKGVFTDNKVYAGIINENVNLGVGYYNQHGNHEYLDYAHVKKLLDACLTLDWRALKTARVPAPPTPQWQLPHFPKPQAGSKPKAKAPIPEPEVSMYSSWEDVLDMSAADIDSFIHEDPAVAVEAMIGLILEYEAEKAKRIAAERLLS